MKKRKKEIDFDGFKIRTFEPAPDDFNPPTALHSRLAYHGIIPRPDKVKEPELYKKWFKLYSKKMHHIVPEFTRKKRSSNRSLKNRKNIKHGSWVSGGWAGVSVNSPVNDPFKWVTGNWMVPNVSQPFGQPTDVKYFSSAWIGIDNNYDVLQAGTECDIITQNGVTTKSLYVWCEWWTSDTIVIDNFPISAGDYMNCLICSINSTSAIVYLNNITAGVSTSFNLTAPSGTNLEGNIAEWVIEAPGVPTLPLADYGATFFDNSFVSSQSGTIVNAGSGDTISMKDTSGNIISEGTIEGNQILKVTYTG